MVDPDADSADGTDAYTVIAHETDVETEVQRSRFLARLRRVEDEESARAVIDEARREHRTARHHCTAFVFGPTGQLTRSNDDGEPAGTAGAPMLETLTGRGVSDVVAVVTRYFGGIKLGTGGLVRAYGDAVSSALDAAGTLARRRVAYMSVLVDIVDAGRLEHDLRADGLHVTDVEYAADATLTAAVPAARAAGFIDEIAARTGGRALVEPAGHGWVDEAR